MVHLIVSITLILSYSFGPYITYAKELHHAHLYTNPSLTVGAEGFDEKTFMGSEKEASEMKGLTKEETSAKIKSVFKEIDADQNALVSKTELTDWILNSLRKLTNEEANRRFPDYDYDHDGKIGKADHLYSIHGFGPRPEQYNDEGLVPDSPRSLDDQRFWRDLFRLADVDANEELSREEFNAYLQPETYPHTRIVIAPRILKDHDHDSDGDGKMSLREYLNDYSESWHATMTKRFSEEYDKDGDGFLTGVEVVDWAIPADEELATHEANRLVHAADDDKNDNLTLAEITKHLKDFTGSDLANFSSRLKDEL